MRTKLRILPIKGHQKRKNPHISHTLVTVTKNLNVFQNERNLISLDEFDEFVRLVSRIQLRPNTNADSSEMVRLTARKMIRVQSLIKYVYYL